MKTPKTKPCASVDCLTLLQAYADLCQRHGELLAERVERTRRDMERAEAALLAKLDEHPHEARRIFRDAILSAPAPKLFK